MSYQLTSVHFSESVSQLFFCNKRTTNSLEDNSDNEHYITRIQRIASHNNLVPQGQLKMLCQMLKKPGISTFELWKHIELNTAPKGRVLDQFNALTDIVAEVKESLLQHPAQSILEEYELASKIQSDLWRLVHTSLQSPINDRFMAINAILKKSGTSDSDWDRCSDRSNDSSESSGVEKELMALLQQQVIIPDKELEEPEDKGLINIGNTCYFNAAISVLANPTTIRKTWNKMIEIQSREPHVASLECPQRYNNEQFLKNLLNLFVILKQQSCITPFLSKKSIGSLKIFQAIKFLNELKPGSFPMYVQCDTQEVIQVFSELLESKDEKTNRFLFHRIINEINSKLYESGSKERITLELIRQKKLIEIDSLSDILKTIITDIDIEALHCIEKDYISAFKNSECPVQHLELLLEQFHYSTDRPDSVSEFSICERILKSDKEEKISFYLSSSCHIQNNNNSIDETLVTPIFNMIDGKNNFQLMTRENSEENIENRLGERSTGWTQTELHHFYGQTAEFYVCRFGVMFDSVTTELKTWKIETPMIFPESFYDPVSSTEYNARAFAFHLGDDIESGHYISLVKKSSTIDVDPVWVLRNDDDIPHYFHSLQEVDQFFIMHLENSLWKYITNASYERSNQKH